MLTIHTPIGVRDNGDILCLRCAPSLSDSDHPDLILGIEVMNQTLSAEICCTDCGIAILREALNV